MKRIAYVMCELGDAGTSTTPGVALNSILRLRDDGTLWMVVDSGANRHYVANEDYLSMIVPQVSMVYGVGDLNVHTQSRGNLQGYVTTGSGANLSVSTQATCVPSSSVSLFSVPQANAQGHSVYFEGSRDNGMHCLLLAGTGEWRDRWIPFVWDESTGLWWLQIRPDETAAYGTRRYEETPTWN